MDARQAKLQRHRLRMTLLTVVNSLLQSGVIALYAWTGATTAAVALAFAAASLATTGSFAFGVAAGWLRGLGDERLVQAQLGVNFAVQVVFLFLAPMLWMIFLGSTLITCTYAMIAFTPRQFTWLWLGYGAVTAVALYAGRARFGTPAPTPANIAILWLFFFLGVRRLAITGAQFSRLRAKLSEKNRQLTVLLERNESLANHDDLTGAINRRHLMRLLAEERERSDRTRAAFALALLDIDHFKAINDRHGHAAGDAVLKRLCTLASSSMRATDRFARYGGEEFVLFMPVATTVEAAWAAAERLRTTIAAANWTATLGSPGARVTISAGVAARLPGESVEALLARADGALYEAKHGGRDRCVAAPARRAADAHATVP